MVNDKQTNLVSIQVLRGLAAMWVTIHHTIVTSQFPGTSLLTFLVKQGYNGVYIFFIISGFIIPYSMSKYDYRYKDIGRFMLKRIIRIEPPYLASVALVLIIFYICTLASWYSGPPFSINWANTLGHIAYLNVFTHQPWLCGVYWTLAIEFEFYILIALIYPLLNNPNKKLVYATLLCLIASTFIHAGIGHIFTHISFFIFGICLFLYKAGRIQLGEFFFLLVLTLIVGGFNFTFKFLYGPVIIASITTLLVAFTTMLCILFIKKAPRILLFLGTISYSLYLIHYPVVDRFLRMAHKLVPQFSPFWASVVCVGCIIVYAYVFYLLIEKPFHKLSKKIKLHKEPLTEHPAIPVPVTESK